MVLGSLDPNILVIHSCISLFTCDSVVFPCFMLLFLFMYSGLLSVPSTSLSHSLVYKYLYSVARTSELRLLLLLLCPLSCSSFLSPLRDLEDLSPTHLLILSTRYSFLDPEIQSLEFPCSLTLGNPGSLRDSTGNRAIPWVCPGN